MYGMHGVLRQCWLIKQLIRLQVLVSTHTSLESEENVPTDMEFIGSES